ncbi:uncharacterized protein [Drosophila takahashii]|uniref:uncharacterized protein n=1 Tax=Drosophila takahashii TaxID=29030 RepID=UPI001CF85DAF|nr:uncharacterized protein LOC123003441 [Drosophila takahashii]
MKFLFVVGFIAFAIQLAYSETDETSTTATTTTTTTTAATTKATTTASPSHNKRCWKGNNFCRTHMSKKRCKNPKRCHKTVVIVTHRKH